MQATDRISLRTTPHAKAIIEQASSMMGVSVSHYILTTMYEKSLQLINDTPVWHLTANDKQVIQDLLNNPPTSNRNMTALLALSDNIQDRIEDRIEDKA